MYDQADKYHWLLNYVIGGGKTNILLGAVVLTNIYFLFTLSLLYLYNQTYVIVTKFYNLESYLAAGYGTTNICSLRLGQWKSWQNINLLIKSLPFL